MAVPTNTLQRYTLVGDREDLSDVIYDISPAETPLFSRAKRGKADSTLHEWQTDVLASAAANAHIEGDDTDAETISQPTRVGNYTQISKKVAQVSGSTEAIKRAGRKSEMSRAMSRKMKELKLDIELALFANNGAAVGAAGAARESAGLGAIVISNIGNIGATGATPSYTNGIPATARTDGTQVAFTEAMLQDGQTAAWENGGSPDVLYVGAFNKAAVSAFAGIATKTIDQSKAAPAVIVGSADVYVGEFGNITVMPSRQIRARDAYLIDHEYVEVAYLRPFKQEKLAKTGDSEKRHVIVEWTLKVGNEKAHAGIFDLTTA